MNELAVKSANGTNSETDRSYIQSEVDQLVTEIDRVSTTTKFNETYLLKGTNTDGTIAKLSYTTANTNLGTASKIGSATFSFDDNGMATFEQGTVAAATVTVSSSTYALTSQGANSSACTAETTEAIAEGKELKIDGVTYHLFEDISDAAAEVCSYTDSDTDKYFSSMAEYTSALKTAANNAGNGDVKDVSIAGDGTVTVSAFADLNNALDVSLHVGADSTLDNKITLNLNMMSARGLGINGIKVDGQTADNATAAIDTITDAIQKVSQQRSTLGAVQNRLEHTVNNLDNIVENTTSAESAIRDTDMATEMVKYSNNNILAQAGQAMLAQANQSNQGVLSLLG
jgi:flagellin